MVRKLLLHVTLAGALVIAGLVVGGCKSTPTGPSPGACGTTPSTDTMSAKIQGLDWSSILTLAGHLSGGLVSISGDDGCTPSRTLSFFLVPTGPGTYTIGPGDLSGLTAAYNVGGDGVGLWISGDKAAQGTVTLTTLDATRVAGTFKFTLTALAGTSAVGTTVITDGSFNASFKVGSGR